VLVPGHKRSFMNVLRKNNLRSVAAAAHGSNRVVEFAPGVGTSSGRRIPDEESIYGSQAEAFTGPVAVQAIPGELSRLICLLLPGWWLDHQERVRHASWKHYVVFQGSRQPMCCS
jgi:hypothetical protein